MADISARQNLPAHIRRLAAQRQLYAVAKRVSAFQTFLAAATPLVSAIVVVFDPSAAVWSALAGIVVPILDIGVLNPWQKKLRESAANIQEELDCAVLDLPWNEALAGSRPSPEDVHEAARKYVSNSQAPLENWYPLAIDVLPMYQARIICQRTNCWWDAKLRRRYSVSILVVLGVVSLVVVLVGLLNGLTLEKFVLAVLAPLSPAFLWGIREVQSQNDAAAALDRLKDYGRSLWERLVSNTMNEADAKLVSRELQDAILLRRRENPFVFDWLYRLLRDAYEEQMNAGAQAMVDEIHG